MISFDRSSGRELSANTLPTGSKDEENNLIDSISTVQCNKIVVSYGTKEYTITIIPETGKISL